MQILDVTCHLILVLNQKLDTLYGSSGCLCDSLEISSQLSTRVRERSEHTAETPPIRKSADYMAGKQFGRVKDKVGSIPANSFGDLPFLASAIF